MVKVGKKWVSETLLLDDIAIAEGLVGQRFWTPLNIDKRGRLVRNLFEREFLGN